MTTQANLAGGSQVANIYDIMRQTARYSGDRHRGEIGVEIETETKAPYDKPSLKFWNVVPDGSLRDFGQEYVLKAPVSIPEFEKALEEFDACNKKFKFKDSSVSTSVHVHQNFLNDTFLTLANFLTAYVLVENVLIRYSGPDRLSNLFCLPICDCEGVKDSLLSILGMVNRGLYQKASLHPDKVKYGALNAAPLSKLGTIEVRSFRGETNTDTIQKWINILMKIKTFARREDLTPIKILDMWRTHRDGIIEVIFQEYASELRVYDKALSDFKKKDITGDLIVENLKHACSIAAVSKDWSKFGILKIKPVYKEKIKPDLDALSQAKFNCPYDSLQYHERILVVELYHRSNNFKIVDANEDI